MAYRLMWNRYYLYEQLLHLLRNYMGQDLRAKLRAELPIAYEAWMNDFIEETPIEYDNIPIPFDEVKTGQRFHWGGCICMKVLLPVAGMARQDLCLELVNGQCYYIDEQTECYLVKE